MAHETSTTCLQQR